MQEDAKGCLQKMEIQGPAEDRSNTLWQFLVSFMSLRFRMHD